MYNMRNFVKVTQFLIAEPNRTALKMFGNRQWNIL